MTSLLGRFNMSFEPIKNFTIAPKMSMGYTDNNQPRGRNGWGGGFGNAFTNSLPWFPKTNSNHPSGYWNPMSKYNIAANMDNDAMTLDRLLSYRSMTNVEFEWRVPMIKNLKIRSESGMDYISSKKDIWTSQYLNRDGSQAITDINGKRTLNYNLYANYDKSFMKNHTMNFTLGKEYQADRNNRTFIKAENMTTIYKEIGSDRSPAEDIREANSYMSYEEYLRSYFARANYDFKKKYLLSMSCRRDGSSKFDNSLRWHTFSALGLGWLMSEEQFFKENMPLFSKLQLRASYGETGNKSIESSRFANIYTNKLDDVYGNDDLISGATIITNIGNPLLTWETTNSLDIGIDWSIKKNRYQGSIVYFYQKVTYLLLETEMPPSSTVKNYWDNIRDMRNSGFEFNITSVNIDKEKSGFRWITDFNFSINGNKLLYMDEKRKISGRNILKVGEEINTIYMAESAGVDRETGLDMKLMRIYGIKKIKLLKQAKLFLQQKRMLKKIEL